MSVFQELLKTATKQKNDYYAARSRVGLAACQMAMRDYKGAVANAESALNYGMTSDDADIAVRAALNLSSVYRRMGDFASATQTMRNLNPMVARVTDPRLKMQLYIHSAISAARTRDWRRAEPLFHAGIDAALSLNDVQTAASTWNQLGYMRLRQNDIAKADAALTEAFRLRRLAGNRNLGTSYAYLGYLKLVQGDSRSALNLLNRCFEMASRTEIFIPMSVLHYWRAKAKLGLADTRGALADFERAIDWATQLREDVLPADEFRISYEVELDRMYDDYVATGMNLWLKSRDNSLARRMFEISEQHRSAAFRETLSSSKPLPVEYWTALANYRVALSSAWRSGQAESASQARLEFSRVEARLGVAAEAPEVRTRLASVQKSLGVNEALISFYTGDSQSWAWALTRTSFEAFPIPGKKEIAPVAKRYRDAVESGAGLDGSNIRLYSMLFEPLSPTVQSKKDWLLSLDEGLFEVPFAALGPAKAPLILFHSIRRIQGAALITRPRPPVASSRFVAAGDAIYNSADPRWRGPKHARNTEFARLINTGHEVRATAEAWRLDPKPTLLVGDKFNRETLDRVLRESSGVFHVAAHVVRNEQDPRQVMVGIGLGRDGTPDFLTPSEVGSRALRIGLVTLNGCTSGGGVDLPGVGMVGLTRSWLVAGASSVAATFWPVQDERGDLFATVYRQLSAEGRPPITPAKAARAIQVAQVAAWRSGDVRSNPRNWASVFLSSKN